MFAEWFYAVTQSYLAATSHWSVYPQTKIIVCCLETGLKTTAHVLQSHTETYYIWHLVLSYNVIVLLHHFSSYPKLQSDQPDCQYIVRIATTYEHANGNKYLIVLLCAWRDMNIRGTGMFKQYPYVTLCCPCSLCSFCLHLQTKVVQNCVASDCISWAIITNI